MRSIFARSEQLCQESFERLAADDPQALVDLIERGRLEPADLTFAAEAAGLVNDAAKVIPCLLHLLDHESALVREGAVYGLSPHKQDPKVCARLLEIAANDASPGARAAAQETLETAE